MFNVLCDICRERAATVFVTKIAASHASKQQLCEHCARQRAAGEGWTQHLTGVMGDNGLAGEPPTRKFESNPLDQIVLDLLGGETVPLDEQPEAGLDDLEFRTVNETSLSFHIGEFAAADDLLDELQNTDDNHDAVPALKSLPQAGGQTSASGRQDDARCPKCGTTWDRLRQDGRAGCAQCYGFFSTQLTEVMARVQKAATHIGKQPRSATKRQRRLEYLRTRRDHRLVMLKQRLQAAVAESRYEDAAKLRDKIKMVTSTFIGNDNTQN